MLNCTFNNNIKMNSTTPYGFCFLGVPESQFNVNIAKEHCQQIEFIREITTIECTAQMRLLTVYNKISPSLLEKYFM